MRLFRRTRRPPHYDEHSSDAELLTAVAAGQSDALEILHRRHAPWLRARLWRRCADPDLVDAALQDTFVAVWKGADTFRPRSADGDAGAWIWTIAIRRLISTMRSRANQWIDAREEPDSYEPIGDASAEDLVLLGVEHGPLGAALNALSPELRLALQATVLDGLTVREASRLLDVPEGTVKTRVMRAKAQLRERLTS